MSDLAKLKN